MTKHIFSRNRLWLILVFILYIIYIISQSIHDKNGYLTPDSGHYLLLAQNLLNGNGITTTNYVEGMSTYFATWPVGYPILIAFVSKLTGLDVFWASKVVNIICLGLCLLIMERLFQNRAWIVAMLIFVSTFTELFIYTWSEVPFIFGMLWLVFAIVRYIERQKSIYAIHMLLASLWMFFMRYIGAIGGGIIGLIGFYYLFKKQWKQMLTCWITGGVSLLGAGTYLMVNYIETGLFTGMERIPRAETASEFIQMLREGVTTELNIFSTTNADFPLWTIILVVAGLLLFIRGRHVKALFSLERKALLLPGMFLFAGVIYFIGIVYMRWSAYFDPLNFRLLGPATFMFCLLICSWVTQLPQRSFVRWESMLVFVFGIAFVSNMVFPAFQTLQNDEPTYEETIRRVQQTYEAIPTGSIVAFENFHARYLRPDIQFIKVHFKPYFDDVESVTDFRKRIMPNNAAGVYFQYKSLAGYNYDKSFVKIMKQAKKSGESFIEMPE